MTQIADYMGLITSEHNQRPKFMAMLAGAIQPIVDTIGQIEAMLAAFDLDTASGAQLDAIGLWVGLSRQVATPLAVYFSFDVPGLGWNQGNWKGPHDPDSGLVSLDDTSYRSMLRMKIGANQWDGTAPEMVRLLSMIVQGTGATIFARDNLNMTMDVFVVGAVPAIVTALLKSGFFMLRPSGVLAKINVPSVSGTPIFGFDCDNSEVAGFDIGSWYIPL